MPSTDYLGFGIGLRTPFIESLLAKQFPIINWLEIISENFLISGGQNFHHLEKIRALYPIAMHGVSLSIGSTDPINWQYLKEIKQLAQRINAHWISDHLCWTGIEAINTHDLLPLPYTEEAIEHVVDRLNQVQDYLQQKILIENVSSYVTYQQSTMSEWEFLTEISTRADCLILLDINNVYVSAVNHEFNAFNYLDALPANRIAQIHLAGHSNMGDHIIDTHDQTIINPVWDLYSHALEKFGRISTMIERDGALPPLPDIVEELTHAKNILTKVF